MNEKHPYAPSPELLARCRRELGMRRLLGDVLDEGRDAGTELRASIHSELEAKSFRRRFRRVASVLAASFVAACCALAIATVRDGTASHGSQDASSPLEASRQTPFPPQSFSVCAFSRAEYVEITPSAPNFTTLESPPACPGLYLKADSTDMRQYICIDPDSASKAKILAGLPISDSELESFSDGKLRLASGKDGRRWIEFCP